MTRRGSLVYYLSAWILGCFFTSAAVWIKEMFSVTMNMPMSRSAFGLLFFYFYGLICGALPALIAGYLLRVLMKALRCKTPMHWAVAGGALASGLIVLLGILGRRVDLATGNARLLGLLTIGPKLVLEAGWWLGVPSGAAAAYLLCRIQLAFAAAQP